MNDEHRTNLIATLEGTATSIRRIEEQARQALHGEGDETTYRELMREKAEVLQNLPLALAPILDQLPSKLHDRVSDRVEQFAHSASMALNLNSVFFMYALLYPEDYREGDPNDLERFIQELKRS